MDLCAKSSGNLALKWRTREHSKTLLSFFWGGGEGQGRVPLGFVFLGFFNVLKYTSVLRYIVNVMCQIYSSVQMHSAQNYVALVFSKD